MHVSIRKALSLVSALVLACALVPVSAVADTGMGSSGSSEPSATPRDLRFSDEMIEEMLAAGDYVEGEAIVVVDNTATAGGGGENARSISALDSAEPLMDVSAAAFEEATGEDVADPSAVAGSATLRSLNGAGGGARADEGAGALSIVLVTRSGASTEDLLYELARDPRVVSAEPNYLTSVPDDAAGEAAGAVGSASSADDADALDAPAAPIGDLSDYQWTEGNDGERLSIRNAGNTALKGFDINERAWTDAKAAGWGGASANASGTVAVMDSGIDYTHPDLQDVMWDGEDLATLAGMGGRFGANVSGSGDSAEVMDRNGHGTHCAGIIAASWDGDGTSGVANGAKLIAVKLLNDNGYGSSATELRGYDYLSRIATAVNLKAVNNSWGGSSPYTALSLAVTELGRLGVVSVFATGNSTDDTDEVLFTSATLATNPYAVIVNSSDVTGRLSVFSNYGAYTTDLAAPGSSILSTVLTTTEHFFPEVAGAQNAAYETFADGSPACVSTSAQAGAIGGADASLHYDASASWAVKLADMDKMPGEEFAAMNLANGTDAVCAYTFDLSVNVPKSAQADADSLACFALKCLNPCLSMKTTKRMFIGAYGVQAVASDGSVQLAVNDGLQKMSGRARMVDGWTPLSLNVAELLADANMSAVAFDGADNMTVRMVVMLPYEPDADDTVNFDCIGVGSKTGTVGSYDVLSGTSMAAPVATGAAAVLSYGEKSSQDVLAVHGAESLASAAAERAARLKGSVRQMDTFAGTCRSGGALDLGVGEAGLAPSITGAEVAADGKTVTVEGFFFGKQEGSCAVAIDGKPTQVVSWGERSVTVACSEAQQSGGAAISLTAANGKTAQAKIVLLFPDDGADALLYERTLASPAKIDAFVKENPALFSSAAFDGSLYVLVADESLIAAGLWRYDIARDEWSRCADVPAALVCLTGSLTATSDGLALLGTDESGDRLEQCLYRYAPDDDSWSKMPCTEDSVYSSIVSQGDDLLFVGGIDDGGYLGIRLYDPKTGDTTHVADLPVGTLLPSVTVSDGGLTIAQGVTDDVDEQPGLLMRASEEAGVWTVTQVAGVLPSDNPTKTMFGAFGFAGYAGGIAVVGLPEAGRDTALLADGATQLERYDKTLSTEPVYGATAVAYEGYLYALAFSNLEPERVVFRATAIDTGSGDAGDKPGGEGGTSPKPIAPTDTAASSSAPLAQAGDSVAPFALPLGVLLLAALVGIACAAVRLHRKNG